MAMFVSISEASFCSCTTKVKEKICGTNGVTYDSRCEFECAQAEYVRLTRKLGVKNMGPCN